MFVEGPFLGARMILVAVLSIAIGFADYHLNLLSSLRETLATLVAPVQWVVSAPSDVVDWTEDAVKSRRDLQQENDALRNRLLILEAKSQRLASLTAEVNRLRELLNASSVVDDSVLVSEIIGINPDPYMHEVVVNKGSDDGVYVGQPMLDSQGLMGQVTQVSPLTSRVLLISDSNHAVPIQVNRNGVRGILVGSGVLDRLQLINVPDTADIVVGDLLVSSGLGGKFPAGYPVAKVTAVVHDPGEPFARIEAHPLSELNRSRHVLLVFKKKSSEVGDRVSDEPSPEETQ
ncbi:rod shape-determining protein MreC [Hahella aquimaris]|uniref:rod shape-determining protein MreC n=1 Tax=Hahella sp. HNIBRBA332 TaxID=3015983 RepID=UPI00273BF39B|nr:rod shape-determining protein MreC [Hahella sp. HNIBRBA332]WLQ17397.1 rod shape-determining protein MreC [Hahella sp. HNIBRBA332]